MTVTNEQLCDQIETLGKTALEWKERAEIATTALRQIRSLEEKNVPKYAQKIAQEAMRRLAGG